MNILITGGAGFVGSNLAIYLKTRYPSWNIYAFDNLKRRGSELNISRLNKVNINFIHGDIRNNEDYFPLIDKNINLLLECSAESSAISGYSGNSFYVVNTNLNGLINCLEFCKKVKCDIIFFSTSRVYPHDKINKIPTIEIDTRFIWSDNHYKQGISENFTINGAKTLYGATKLSGEFFIQEYAELFDFNYVINRFGVIAGPWQFGKIDQGVFTLWMLNHYLKKELKYIGFGGKGKQVRDIIHIDDVCKLIELQIFNFDKINKEIFNIGGGKNNTISLLEATNFCEKITGNKITIVPDFNNRYGDMKIYFTDNSKINSKLNWKPMLNIEKIFYDIFKWIDRNKKLLIFK